MITRYRNILAFTHIHLRTDKQYVHIAVTHFDDLKNVALLSMGPKCESKSCEGTI